LSPDGGSVKLDPIRLTAYQEVPMKQIILAAVLGAFTVSGFAADHHEKGKKPESCKMECCKKDGKDAKACKDCKDCKEKMAKPEKKA
jgi:hypothetical protein